MDATVQTLITDFSNGELSSADLTQCGQFYSDILGNLAVMPILVSYTDGIAASAGICSYPANTVNLLKVFRSGVLMSRLTVREANWAKANWRVLANSNIYAYVIESESRYTFQFVGTVTDSATQVLATYTTNTLPQWLQMPMAMLVLSEEYRKESSHQNLELANAFKAMGDFLISCVLKK